MSTKTAKKKIDILYSDVSFGTHEYGFLTRERREDADDEDGRYEAYVQAFNRGEVRVYDGVLYVW